MLSLVCGKGDSKKWDLEVDPKLGSKEKAESGKT